MQTEDVINKVKEIVDIRRKAITKLEGEHAHEHNVAIVGGGSNEERALYIAHHIVDSEYFVQNPSEEFYLNSRARHLNIASMDLLKRFEEMREDIEFVSRVQGSFDYTSETLVNLVRDKSLEEREKLEETMDKVNQKALQELLDNTLSKYQKMLE